MLQKYHSTIEQRFGKSGVLDFIKVGFVLGSWFLIRYIWLTKSPTDAKPQAVVCNAAKNPQKTKIKRKSVLKIIFVLDRNGILLDDIRTIY